MAGRPKRCGKCNNNNGPAAKRCRICKETIAVDIDHNEDSEEDARILNMGKTNPTKQFNLLKKRAKILKCHHGWDIVVLASYKHVRGNSFVTFGTAGLAQSFIGTVKNQYPTGKAVLDVFRSYINEKKTFKSDPPSSTFPPPVSTAPLPICTLSPPIASPPPISTVPLPTSNVPQISTVPPPRSTVPPPTSTVPPPISTIPPPSTISPPTSTVPPPASTVPPPASTNHPPASTVHPQTSTVHPPISVFPPSVSTIPPSTSTIPPPTSTIPPPTSTIPSPTSTIPSPTSSVSTKIHTLPSQTTTTIPPPASTTTSVSAIPSSSFLSTDLIPTTLTSSIDMPSDAVALYTNGNIVAIGTIQDLPSIHGHPLPKGCSCVMLSWVQDNYPAPCPLGRNDLMENVILHKDMFYALPRRMLKQFLRCNDRYFLSPLP